jgi:Arc/MetJ-type ribon-helix-helix transcriptional regulator
MCQEDAMAERVVRLRLNQQQLELIDNSVKAGEATSGAELIRRALREHAASQAAPRKD